MAGSPEAVVAFAVGHGLAGQAQRVRRGDGQRRWWLAMSGQDVQNDRCRRGAFGQGLDAGSLDGFQSIRWDHAQDLDHLTVTVRHAPQLTLDASYRRRQFPFLEGSAVSKGAGLAGQHRDVVQRVIDGLVAPAGADGLADDPAFVADLAALRMDSDLD